jgi:hypothetical protein
MADRAPSTSRRALLGAAAALPLAAIPVIARSGATKQSSPAAPAALDCRASLAKTWNYRLFRYRAGTGVRYRCQVHNFQVHNFPGSDRNHLL